MPGRAGEALSLPYDLSSITDLEHDIQATLDAVRGKPSSCILCARRLQS